MVSTFYCLISQPKHSTPDGRPLMISLDRDFYIRGLHRGLVALFFCANAVALAQVLDRDDRFVAHEAPGGYGLGRVGAGVGAVHDEAIVEDAGRTVVEQFAPCQVHDAAARPPGNSRAGRGVP